MPDIINLGAIQSQVSVARLKLDEAEAKYVEFHGQTDRDEQLIEDAIEAFSAAAAAVALANKLFAENVN